MNRRRALRFLALPAVLAGAGGTWRANANPYYQGPPTDHFDGLRFSAPGGPPPAGFLDFLRWRWNGDGEAWPKSYPAATDTPPARVAGPTPRVSFIGHASFLIQLSGLNILIDPVYARRAGPLVFGPERVNEPGVPFDKLPPIDVVLVSHNHYDHMDLAVMSRLAARDRPRVVTPLGNDTILNGHDPAIRAEAHDWGARLALNEAVALHLEPSLHWSARGVFDRRMALWASFVIESAAGKIYHVADTAFGDGEIFKAARAKHGAFSLAILPIGAYEPRWFMKANHINPEEAVAILGLTGAGRAIAHHWGTFKLTDEGIERPLEALDAALKAASLPQDRFTVLRPGEVSGGTA